MSHSSQDMKEVLHDVYEGLSEEELLAHSRHKSLEHTLLLARNIAVGVAALLFLLSLAHFPGYHLCKGVAYFLGAAAYFLEIVLLTDCFSRKVPHQEMFMAYCFGPIYILLGISYLLS